MGWASGSSLLDEVAKLVMPLVNSKPKRAKLAGQLIDLFEGEDCDTINECAQRDISKEYDRRNPDDN